MDMQALICLIAHDLVDHTLPDSVVNKTFVNMQIHVKRILVACVQDINSLW